MRRDSLTDSVSRWLTAGAVTIVNNSAAVAGGGLALLSCDTVLGGITAIGNKAGEGGGVFASGSGGVHMCAALLMANEAAVYGGGLATQDVTKDVHLCNEAACSRFLLLTTPSASTSSTSSEPRLPFRSLLASMTSRTQSALDTFSRPVQQQPQLSALALPRYVSDALRGATPPAPASFDMAALWTGMAAAADAAAVDGAIAARVSALQGAGDNATCALAGNVAGVAGGDVSVRSASSAAAVAASGKRAVAYLRRSLLYASTSAAMGGSVYAAGVPVSLTSLDIVAPAAGDAFAAVSAGSTTAAALSGNSTVTFTSGTGGLRAGFGGAIALLEPVYAEVAGIRSVGAFARFGGTLWVQPFAAASAAAIGATASAGVAAAGNSSSASSSSDETASAGPPRLDVRLLSTQEAVTSVRAMQAAAATSANLPPPPLDGRLLLSGMSVRNSSSAAAGAGLFLQGTFANGSVAAGLQALWNGSVAAAAPNGNSSASLGLPLVIGQPPRAPAAARLATLPVTIFGASTLPLSSDGVIDLVSLSPAPAPLAVLHLRDALNETTAYDDSTVCTVSVASLADGGNSALALIYPPRYTAAAGIVTISPFGISSAPGSSGTARVTCAVSLGGVSYSLSAVVATVRTVRVRLQLDAVAAAVDPSAVASVSAAVSPFCNNTSNRRPRVA